MLEVLRSSVNTWECDQMGHLNVRHYFARAAQGWAVLALELGLGPRELGARGHALRATEQHVRFHHELRPGVPYTISAGVLEARAEGLRVYEELRSLAADRVSATIVSEVRLEHAADCSPRRFDEAALQKARALSVTLPSHAEARGLSLEPSGTLPAYGGVLAERMVPAFIGPVLVEDCDAQGFMLESSFMAHVSDGIAHFFRRVREGLRPDGVGGAALEYRFAYRERPRVAEVIEVRSALTGLGHKTLELGHAFFNLETKRCVATSAAIAVSFDLATRKSVEISDEARAAMSQHLVTGFRV